MIPTPTSSSLDMKMISLSIGRYNFPIDQLLLERFFKSFRGGGFMVSYLNSVFDVVRFLLM